MSKLSEALAAMDKATPGPWNKPYYDDYPGDRGWWIHNGEKGADEYAVAVTFEGNPKAEHDAIVLAAAPDALAWIKEALPYITEYRDALATHLGNCDFGPHEEGAVRKELARLDALIARVKKPEEVDKFDFLQNVDWEIRPIVVALNSVGIKTIASCSGHGYRPGSIALSDGRELVIARNYKEARKIDSLFPLNIHGEPIPTKETSNEN